MARAILEGLPVSPGIAIAPLKILGDSYLYEKRAILPEEVDEETAAIYSASEKVRASLRKTIDSIPAFLADYKDIVAAQMELARDPRIIGATATRVKHLKICAAQALAITIDELASMFNETDNPYLRERTRDIKAIGRALGRALPGQAFACREINGGIVAARDISPADMMEFSGQGLITVDGGPASHTAILARGMNAPAVVGVARLFEEARQCEMAIVDGLSGVILLSPDEEDINKYRKIGENYRRFAQKAGTAAKSPAISQDGTRIDVLANLEIPEEADNLDSWGAEGVGLYRTEFSFLYSQRHPSEEELFEEYSRVLACGKPTVFRVLDAGADKLTAEQEVLNEPNPALGERGIRFCLSRREIFSSQLRAILRAAHGREASILLPMITAPWEIKAVRELIWRAERELAAEKKPRAEKLPLGAMIETPSAAIICDLIAAECDFLSLGTNDLLHYLLAIDRNNPRVSHLYDPLHPAFLRILRDAITMAHNKGVKISVCGELAADPLGIPLLAGLGVDAFSASPRYIPAIKQIIRNLDIGKARSIIADALANDDFYKIKSRFRESLSDFIETGALPYNSNLTVYSRI
ncbi:MAG: phosphoenolpyruvate--protein phosphotransferase [Desulfovibrio sp.]|nr:phosphoenolpyruvate--protein phosphotransferase [Desulfovibrio sp.]